jgi:hypothetical protein
LDYSKLTKEELIKIIISREDALASSHIPIDYDPRVDELWINGRCFTPEKEQTEFMKSGKKYRVKR